MLDRIFKLSDNGTTVRTEVAAGLTTFLTMAYIIFVQPAVLSGQMFDMDTGMDFGAVTTATCLAAAVATLIMGIYARYPIALAPGMGENFFFVFSVLPAAAGMGVGVPWRIALTVVFIAGILFFLLSISGVRKKIIDAVSPSMKNGIAVGIGLFIAFIGFQQAGVVLTDPGTAVKLNTTFASPDMAVFFVGLFVASILMARHVRGALLWGIAAATLLAVILRIILPLMPEYISGAEAVASSNLMTQFKFAEGVVSTPPSMAPTFFKFDFAHALSLTMLPFIIVFLFMDVFDTMGTLIGVGEQAGFMKDNKLPRAERAMLADSTGTVAGAAMGTSTVTSFIESAAGVEQGGRTGLTAVTTALLFLFALFFSPIIAMVGSYPAVTAPALVVVGALMLKNVVKIDWSDASEFIPAFLTMTGIPFFYSISDGLGVGLISYPVIKLFCGRGRDVGWLMYALAIILLGYFILVR